MPITPLQRKNVLSPSGNVAVQSPADARRAGENLSQFGNALSNVGEVMARTRKVDNSSKIYAAKTLAREALNELTLTAGAEATKNGTTEYEELKKGSTEWLKKHFESISPEDEAIVADHMKNVFLDKLEPLATKAGADAVRNTENKMASNFLAMEAQVEQMPDTIDDVLKKDLMPYVASTAATMGMSPEAANKLLKDTSRKMVMAAAMGYTRFSDMGAYKKSIDLINGNTSLFKNEDEIKAAKATISKAFAENTKRENDLFINKDRELDDISRTKTREQTQALFNRNPKDLNEVNQISEGWKFLVANGELPPESFSALEKIKNPTYVKVVDQEAELNLANRFFAGESASSMVDYINKDLLVNGKITTETAKKWITNLKSQDSKFSDLTDARQLMRTVFKSEETIGALLQMNVIDKGKAESERQKTIKGIIEFRKRLDSGKYSNAMDAAIDVMTNFESSETTEYIQGIPIDKQGDTATADELAKVAKDTWDAGGYGNDKVKYYQILDSLNRKKFKESNKRYFDILQKKKAGEDNTGIPAIDEYNKESKLQEQIKAGIFGPEAQSR